MRIATKVSNTITLGDTIEKFMVRKKADSLAKKTMDDYRRELNRFLKSSSNSISLNHYLFLIGLLMILILMFPYLY